ncbi:hypothetical protein K503DRAFT_703869, partial [Rhizopogon vinicolor AM-OR11-026]
DKTGCGFYSDATAKLLCPVDFDWKDTRYDLFYVASITLILILTIGYMKL